MTATKTKIESPAWATEIDYRLKYFHLLNDYDRLLLGGISQAHKNHTKRLVLRASLAINIMLAVAFACAVMR
jgi:hypothetical protein